MGRVNPKQKAYLEQLVANQVLTGNQERIEAKVGRLEQEARKSDRAVSGLTDGARAFARELESLVDRANSTHDKVIAHEGRLDEQGRRLDQVGADVKEGSRAIGQVDGRLGTAEKILEQKPNEGKVYAIVISALGLLAIAVALLQAFPAGPSPEKDRSLETSQVSEEGEKEAPAQGTADDPKVVPKSPKPEAS